MRGPGRGGSLREESPCGNRILVMDAQGQPIWKEWSSWPGWLVVVFWGTMFLGMTTVSWAPGESDQDRFWGLIVLAVTAGSVQFLIAGLSVRLFRDDLVVGLGSAGWISRRVRYEDILRTESVTYRPIAEFGGWGVRRGRNGKRAWTARGNHAVVLHLRDGTHLYVGSDSPHRLEERIRAVGGTRIGG